jgi:hypothetical protein
MRRFRCPQVSGTGATTRATDAPALIDAPLEKDAAEFEVHGTSIN